MLATVVPKPWKSTVPSQKTYKLLTEIIFWNVNSSPRKKHGFYSEIFKLNPTVSCPSQTQKLVHADLQFCGFSYVSVPATIEENVNKGRHKGGIFVGVQLGIKYEILIQLDWLLHIRFSSLYGLANVVIIFCYICPKKDSEPCQKSSLMKWMSLRRTEQEEFI